VELSILPGSLFRYHARIFDPTPQAVLQITKRIMQQIAWQTWCLDLLLPISRAPTGPTHCAFPLRTNRRAPFPDTMRAESNLRGKKTAPVHGKAILGRFFLWQTFRELRRPNSRRDGLRPRREQKGPRPSAGGSSHNSFESRNLARGGPRTSLQNRSRHFRQSRRSNHNQSPTVFRRQVADAFQTTAEDFPPHLKVIIATESDEQTGILLS